VTIQCTSEDGGSGGGAALRWEVFCVGGQGRSNESRIEPPWCYRGGCHNQQRQAGEFRGGPNQRAGDYGRNKQCGEYGRSQRADVHLNQGRCQIPNPNPRFGNAGGGYKRGVEEREVKVA
jgi:hypothetical protein